MAEEKELPAPAEIETQLERIVAGRTFATSPTPRKLLEEIVKSEQRGEAITEYELGILVCGKPEGWNPKFENAIRQQGVNLRKLLRKYYSGEGKEDLVIINVPKRRGYKPDYQYNPITRSLRLYRRAVEVFDQTFPQITPTATSPVLDTLRDSIKANNAHAPAHAAMGEILLLYTMCDEPTYFSPKWTVAQAELASRTCLSLDPEHWLAHMVIAAVHCCRFEWEEAERAFEAALGIEREKTTRHFFYLAYLAAIGRIEDSIRLARRRWQSSEETELVYLPELFFGYISRDYGQTYQDFMKYSKAWDFTMNQVAYEIGLEILLCNWWPTEVLLACIVLGLGSEYGALHYAESGSEHSRSNCYAGVKGLALASLGKCDPQYSPGHRQIEYGRRAAALLEAMEENPEWFGPVNMALMYTGLGRNQEAIEHLGKACDENDPLMVWLHLWPMLDPLREEKGFKALIQRMNLPSSALASAAALRAAGAVHAAAAAEQIAIARRKFARGFEGPAD